MDEPVISRLSVIEALHLLVISTVVIGIGLLPWLILSGPLSQSYHQSEWPTVQGSVLTADTTYDPGDFRGGGPEYWGLEVGFHYEVDSVRYADKQAWRIRGDKIEAEQRVLRYASGTPVQVYYNPKKPSSAVVVPGGQGHWVFMVEAGGAIFILAGVAPLGFGVWIVVRGWVRWLRQQL